MRYFGIDWMYLIKTLDLIFVFVNNDTALIWGKSIEKSRIANVLMCLFSDLEIFN
jgi:hypothetical protein